jgi:hypothetical protein
MMSAIRSFIICLLLTGCGSIQTMNTNMEHSSALIQTNTEAVRESTQTMQESTKVIANNTALLERITQPLSTHPSLIPGIFFLVLLLLIVPSLILYLSYRSLLHKIDSLLDKLSSR